MIGEAEAVNQAVSPPENEKLSYRRWIHRPRAVGWASRWRIPHAAKRLHRTLILTHRHRGNRQHQKQECEEHEFLFFHDWTLLGELKRVPWEPNCESFRGRGSRAGVDKCELPSSDFEVELAIRLPDLRRVWHSFGFARNFFPASLEMGSPVIPLRYASEATTRNRFSQSCFGPSESL